MEDERDERPPIDLIAVFERCVNYPRDRAGVQALAQGLAKASQITGISAAKIVERCCEESSRCPTDAELLQTARGLQAPNSEERKKRRGPCPLKACDGSGFIRVCFLWTHKTEKLGEEIHNYVEKELISEQQYDHLRKIVDWKTQEVYDSVRRCRCNPAREPLEPTPRPRKRKALTKFGEAA